MNKKQAPFRKRNLILESVRRLLHKYRIAKISFFSKGNLKHGELVFVAKNCDIRAPHSAVIGNYVSFGKNFTCETDILIGNDVLISSNVSFVGKDHPFDDKNITVFQSKRVDNSFIEVGSDVLIGFGSIVIGSVKIGDGCIIGAGSVVTRDLPPYTVCAGVPAAPIRPRY